MVYYLANGIGRTKLNKDSTLRKLQNLRTIVVITGETQLLADNVTGGANTRLLIIAAPKVILPADICKEIRSIIKENYGLVFPLLIIKIFELGFDNLRILTLFDGVLNSVLDVINAFANAIIATKVGYWQLVTTYSR